MKKSLLLDKLKRFLKAEKVDCSLDEFVGGLSGIMITIKERWELAVDEQRQREKGKED